MKRLEKFLQLSPIDRGLLVRVVLLVGAIRIGLCLLPFQTLRRWLARLSERSNKMQPTDSSTIDRIAWAAAVASRYVPKATCLAQALAAQALLEREGFRAHLRLGVAKSEGQRLQAHAWVEIRGEIVIGGREDVARFTPLPPLDGERT